MSMLMNTLRKAMGAAREEPAKEPPAWRQLGAQTGVQDMQYADVARPGVHHLFAHEPRRLLDIGCGSGAVGANLKQTLPHLWVWGCELNQESARVAATRLDHVTAVPRERWDAQDLELVHTIDTVLLLDVLEHMYNPWVELEFLARALPRDAQVIVSLPNVGHLSVLRALAEGAFPYSAYGILDVTHVRFFTFAGMCEMFGQTGFRIDETWILSGKPETDIKDYPARVIAGKVAVEVESAEEWARLNAIQFGFRLRRAD